MIRGEAVPDDGCVDGEHERRRVAGPQLRQSLVVLGGSSSTLLTLLGVLAASLSGFGAYAVRRWRP